MQLIRIALFSLLASATSAFAADVIVNGVRLEDSTRQTLERTYGVPIKPGKYWYDSVSGVWGVEGGPAAGQIHSGLRLGGSLKREASAGKTGVVVNGRELHELDVAALKRCVAVIPGAIGCLPTGSAAPKAARRNSTLPRCAARRREAARACAATTTAADNSTAATSAPASA
jgi:hypothetical protein